VGTFNKVLPSCKIDSLEAYLNFILHYCLLLAIVFFFIIIALKGILKKQDGRVWT
jgi:hypothetical protein